MHTARKTINLLACNFAERSRILKIFTSKLNNKFVVKRLLNNTRYHKYYLVISFDIDNELECGRPT